MYGEGHAGRPGEFLRQLKKSKRPVVLAVKRLRRERRIPVYVRVGRVPSSAPDPMVRLSRRMPDFPLAQEADGGVGRGPGGPPHHTSLFQELRAHFQPNLPKVRVTGISHQKSGLTRDFVHTPGDTRKSRPVISGGCCSPSTASSVGAMSCSAPPGRSFHPWSFTRMNGTGLVV
jgi:hypothetical protein